MRYFILLMMIVLFSGCGKNSDQQNMSREEIMKGIVTSSNEMFIYYTCPMGEHKHTHAKEPGACPKCGMALVKAVVTDREHMEFWGCPMPAHSYVRETAPGKCMDCGMSLKPMRLQTEQ